MKKIVKIITVMIGLAVLLTVQEGVVMAQELSFTKTSVVSNGTIMNGVTYEQIKGTSYTDGGSIGTQQISYVKADKGTVQIVSWSSTSSDGIKGKNVLALAKDYETKNPGFKVLAAINGDYFSASSGLSYPINGMVSNGNVYKYNNHAKYASLGIDDLGQNYCYSKTNQATSAYYLTIYDETGTIPLEEIPLNGQNTMPGNDQTTFFYKNNSAQSSSASLYEVASPSEYFNLASIYIKGKVTGSVSKTTYNPIIATNNQAVKKMLDQNPIIRIQKNMKGELANYNQIIGIGSQPLKEGSIQAVEQIGDQSVDFCNARHPRSAIGFTEDGDLLMVAIDGRQTNMSGATLREEAVILKSLGAFDCFNFDGGGSTELVVRIDDQLMYYNSPSETYRSVVNALLIVVPDVLVKPKVTVVSDTEIKLDYQVQTNNVNLTSLDLYVNGEKQESLESYTLTNLNKTRPVMLTFKAKYQKDGVSYQRVVKTIKVYLSEIINPPVVEKVKPSNFEINFKKTSKGFEAIITCLDEFDTLSKIYLYNGNDKYIAIKSSVGYVVSIEVSETTTYQFVIEYYYRINTLVPVSETVEQKFDYTYDNQIPVFNILFENNKNDGFNVMVEIDDLNDCEIKKIQLVYNNNDIDIRLNEWIEISNAKVGDHQFKIKCEYISDGITYSKIIDQDFTYYYQPKSSGCNAKDLSSYLVEILSILSMIIILRKRY